VIVARIAGEAPAAPSPSLLLKVADEAGTGVTIYGQEKDAQELLTGRIRLV
jgi:hypothetical protein